MSTEMGMGVLDAAPCAAIDSMPRVRYVAIYAPHLVTPLRNGADVYIWKKWGALDPGYFKAKLFAADGTYRLDESGWVRIEHSATTARSRLGALAVALFRGSDYLSAKFNTRAYLDRVRSASKERFELSIYSFASTYGFISSAIDGEHDALIETHNHDVKFYLDRGAEARGVSKIAGWIAAGRAYKVLNSLPRHVPIIALGESDAALFRAFGHREVIVTGLGYEAKPKRARFPSGSRLSIAFVGSLSVTMNAMAIARFVSDALPLLRKHLACGLDLHVAGSRPSPALVAELKRGGAKVHADLPDDALNDLLGKCHATILPFHSTNGLKLKFAHSASVGVPILSYFDPPPELACAKSIHASKDMERWAQFLLRLRDQAALTEAATELQAIARQRSWYHIVQADLEALQVHWSNP